MIFIKEKLKPPALDDEEFLIEKARENPAAFQPLYDQYYEPIFRFIYARIADEEEAADLCSAVFLKALQHLKTYEHKGFSFGAWLYKIAYNETLQYFRRHKRQRTVLISEEFLDTLYPAENELRHLLISKLLEAIQELNYQEVQLIELKYWEKKGYQEIAYIMGISVTNAKTKMHRTYKKLETQLKKYLP